MPVSRKRRQQDGPRMAKTCGALLATVLLTITGCAAGNTETTDSGDSHYPVTVSTCGHEVSFDSAPSRVVAQPHNLVEVQSGRASCRDRREIRRCGVK